MIVEKCFEICKVDSIHRLLQQSVSGFLVLLSIGLTSAFPDDQASLVLEIIQQHCVHCHNDRDRDGGLSLISAESIEKGGESGSIIDFNSPEDSFLLEQIVSVDGHAEMPKNSSPLTAEQVEVIRRWIIDGANWPEGRTLQATDRGQSDWWSLQPLVRPAVPFAENSTTERVGIQSNIHPVDAFVLDKLQENQLTFAPEASRRSLIRRLYYDLIGLPPSPEEIQDFLSDDQPGAVERVVDRLLLSPAYGERWARHWMDVAHFADTHGYDKDQPRPNAWPYRDYLIRSFNQDKPWGQMIREQVAGDALYPNSPEAIEALGFLAAGPWDLVGHAEVPESKIDGQIARHLDRDDMVRTTVQSFMSLTVGCAQCHDHKFDPIDQIEYYQLHAVFAALDRADKPYYSDPELNARFQNLRIRHRDLQRLMAEVEAAKESSDDNPEILRLRQEWQSISDEMARLPEPKLVYAGTVHDGSGNFKGTGHLDGAARPIYLLSRGDVTRPVGEMLKAEGLAIVDQLEADWSLTHDAPDFDRRAALAEWLSDDRNFFTWRSIVNRVWQYHFGQGLVDTPDDFGRMGGVPSHPELLEWLAVEFRDNGQSLKQLHRWIVTSRTYRQSSSVDAEAESTQRAIAADRDNRLLWRANRRRLEAEAVRDSILMLAGKLDLTMGGPGFQQFVMQRPEHSPHYRYDLHDFDDPVSHRRSVYRFTVRSQLHPFLTAMDCADPSQQVAKRNESLSPLQALAMMNNGLVMTMSSHFAKRLAAQLAEHLPERKSLTTIVARGFEEVTGRSPDPLELERLVTYASEFGLENTCRVLFNLNEFLYID